jgi:hypothetical protein
MMELLILLSDEGAVEEGDETEDVELDESEI